MTKRIKMEQFVKTHYPNAVFDYYFDTKFGTELQFRACEETDETWACVLKNGKMEIVYDF